MRILAAASFSLCLVAGCARVPPLPTGTKPPIQLKVTFSVRGQIQPLDAAVPYSYFVVFQRTDDPNSTDVPAPVVAPPWGNGFAAPSRADGQGFIGFVSYGYRGLDYREWSCRVGGTLRNPTLGVFSDLGRPLDSVLPPRGANGLSFTLNLNDFDDPASTSTTSPRYVILNIIATSNLPQGADDVPKLWDALGDGRTTTGLVTPIVIDTGRNNIKRNTDSLPIVEPTEGGDVRDRLNGVVDEPNLDLVDWNVEVVRQSS